MGLSRRLFTKEFKLAAVRRLEQGVSMGKVARAMEVNPNVLHRWRHEFREAPGNVISGQRASGVGPKAGLPNWTTDRPAGAGNRFFEGVLAAHREQRMMHIDWSCRHRKIGEEVKGGLTDDPADGGAGPGNPHISRFSTAYEDLGVPRKYSKSLKNLS